jgi:TPR repeat protein
MPPSLAGRDARRHIHGSGKVPLVFRAKERTVDSMEPNWYHRFFRGSAKARPDATRTQAEQGDADAQFRLGLHCATCQTDPPDYAQAALWYRKAAEQSHALAQFNLGQMHAAGQGMPQDTVAAERWFQKAACQGDAAAQFNLGLCFQRASLDRQRADILESRIEAYKWFLLAAAQGYKGSDLARESVNIHMSRADVAEGNERAAAILAALPKASSGN